MSTRKLQQEMEKVFKKIDEGVAEFEALHEKIEQSTNPAQKEKLEDQLKREIKKLQRMRDQIKTWAASNDIKDKSPLLEKRKLIETQMEKFKAIEKAMKTKAYSKEGLSAAARLDPKEQAKLEAGEFLGEMVDSLEQQIEELEVTAEALSNAKRGKNNGRQERLDEIEGKIERHKYHQGKLELIRRSLENGGIETEQVKELEEEISYYVKSNQDSDFIENDYIYDDLNLDADEDNFGMHISDDKSAGDTTSTHDDGPSPGEAIIEQLKASTKPRNTENLGKRQVSAQLKSPLPSLATLHSTPSSSGAKDMKPAPVPMRPAGEGLKYASAAAAAAAADKSNIGLLPLPPPPGAHNYRASATSSPVASVSQPVSHAHNDTQSRAVPSAKSTPKISSSKLANSTPTPEPATKGPASNSTSAPNKTNDSPSSTPQQIATTTTIAAAPTTGTPNGSKAVRAVSTASTITTPASVAAPATPVVPQEEECIYHLPASLRDLVEAYEVSYSNPMPPSAPAALRMLDASQRDAPKATDGDRTRHYVPEIPANMPNCTYPTQPLPLLDHPKIYNKLETDTLFYLFYYRQGTVQQYLAAKALKDQSWRFHKQYQTWFQRHEEPKNITEEYEQGTYRFFDYESTWMNRRKADFKFAYKFLEDDI